MTGEEIERAIEFLLDQQARTSTKVQFLLDQQTRTSADVQALTQTVEELARQAEVDRIETRETLRSVITEMRDGFNHLIVAGEATRELANNVARLEVQTSQRVSGLEKCVSDIEGGQ